MARIVYAWELGGDYGHIGSFMPLALALREQGHEVIFVIRDLSNAEVVVSKHRFQILQAPIWSGSSKGLPHPPLNYTEIILRFGFMNKSSLSALNRAWLGLFAMIRPAMVIADHSPVALFSARAVGIPRAVYGTGFCSPPHISPMPNMRPWAKVSQKRLADADAHAIAVMNSLLSDMKSKANPLTMVADLFKVDIDFLCTFPEMDHYQQRQDAHYWGPVFNTAHGKELAWHPADGKKPTKRIFMYIKPEYKKYEEVLSSVKVIAEKDKNIDVLIFSPGITPKLLKEYQSDRMRFATHPIQLEGILPSCDLAVCHAGHGTVAACLLAGVPLLLLPMQLEQFLASLRIRQLGAAELAHLETKEPIDFGGLITKMLTNIEYKQKAKAFAKRHAKFDQANQFNNMATKINELINTKQ